MKEVLILHIEHSADIFGAILDYIYTGRLRIPFEVLKLREMSHFIMLYNLGALENLLQSNLLDPSLERTQKLWIDISSLYNNERLSDIRFVLEDSGKTFFAHKVSLRFSSY